MNNGKVRIYELSKELNLDNRDILAVCEQLNISVKSHSSTITEGEAERIRAAAEKYTATHSSPPKPVAVSHGTGAQAREAAQAAGRKPQILEIRRPKTISPNQQSADDGNEPIPQAAKPNPQPPINQPLQTPVKPAAPSRPARSAPSAPESAAPAVSIPNSPSSETPVEVASPASEPEKPQVKRPPSITEEPAPRPRVSHQPTIQPQQLVAPPSRPAPPTANRAQANPANRVVLKRDRPERPEGGTSSPSSPSEPRVGQPPSERRFDAPARQRDRPAAGSDSDERRPQPVTELRRPASPARPVRPTAPREGQPGTSGDRAGGHQGERSEAAVGAGPIDELRRPTLPRNLKKGKSWEEEEEENAENAKAKAGPKAKRRLQPVLDDEDIEIEDLDIDSIDEEEEFDDGEDAPVQVSLSLARPAKPKSRPGQARPVAAAPAAPKSRKSNSPRDRRERREQEAKVERPTKITLTTGLTVQELASLLAVPETEIIRALFFKGIAANINQTLDVPTASMIAQEMEVEVEMAEKEAEARKVTEMLDAADLELLQRRPPVVTIMGHVDHGKTTLLDSIRKTKVAQGEAGGITQHIGAYHVDVPHEGDVQQVVFLDTPGHEAFTAMRARGTRVTDIAILVVAADDGVRPQTIEAISHAKAAEVPIIVAINKIDKEGAQLDRVKNELMNYNLVPEEYGGDTIMVPVSAIKGENLDTLLEMILLVSEVEDLYANPDRPAKGTVIEAHLDKARGPVASMLVQNGTLRVGDTIVAGSALGKVRAMVDDRGQRVEAAGPSFAVEILGLGDVPAAGDEFEVFQDEKEARAVASAKTDQQRQSRLQQQALGARRITLNSLSAKAQEGELKELNLILKADVQGSVEAILGSLQQLPQNEVQVRVLLSAPGEVTETDVDLASASSAVIIGFNTTLASGARQAADAAGVDIREYNIIYKLLDDIQGAMEGLLEPEMVEEPLGQVEVRAVFPVGRGAVAGCYVLSGKAIRNCNARVRRGSNVIHEGILDSLKRMKEDAKEVNAGYECGVGMSSFHDWVEGDIIETFRMVTKRRTLSAS
ncbi:translation initiation factor IF-2 [Trichocoleus sp. FACHB-591]|uniref:translation initiation factor IF-2 n=1 Tax=Trichocoleus sp. FACHB-591 TaxID=2692872 RepID=UPI0016851A45|nr:translation initiation factor IF-2 [Trichocoleus sp. FACHB-591]MBD2098658.1 translation initiation factor IF-2 [Trichocoleus sp. FACHB-591]